MYANSFVNILIFQEKCLVFLFLARGVPMQSKVQFKQRLSLAEKKTYWPENSLVTNP